MIISSTLAAAYFLLKPILEFIDSVYGIKLYEYLEYRSFFFYILALYGVYEFLKQAYRMGKLTQYHSVPESTFAGEIIGCSFVFTVTIFTYVGLVAAFFMNSTQKVVLWNFTKTYPYLILFCHFLYRAHGFMEWIFKLGMEIRSAPATTDKTQLKVVACAAVLFHCQMLIHELYTWRAVTMLCIISAVAMLCFDTLTNFDYLWGSIQRAIMALLCEGMLRRILLMYCDLCDRASSYILQEKTSDLGYPSYYFL